MDDSPSPAAAAAEAVAIAQVLAKSHGHVWGHVWPVDDRSDAERDAEQERGADMIGSVFSACSNPGCEAEIRWNAFASIDDTQLAALSPCIAVELPNVGSNLPCYGTAIIGRNQPNGWSVWQQNPDFEIEDGDDMDSHDFFAEHAERGFKVFLFNDNLGVTPGRVRYNSMEALGAFINAFAHRVVERADDACEEN